MLRLVSLVRQEKVPSRKTAKIELDCLVFVRKQSNLREAPVGTRNQARDLFLPSRLYPRIWKTHELVICSVFLIPGLVFGKG